MSDGPIRSGTRVLVWQWGRRGAGPRVAAEMVLGLARVPDCTAMLSLSTGAEMLNAHSPADVALPVSTYRNAPGFVARVLAAPFRRRSLLRRIAALAPDVAICAMPGPLDLEMASALKRLRVPFLVVVHDADRHPGDGSMMQMLLQRQLMARSNGLIALTRHVADRLAEQGVIGARTLLMASLPPFVFGPQPAAPLAHGGKVRLLCFGRLLSYKGLDLLAEALAPAGLVGRVEVRVVGQGPASAELSRLAGLPGVTVENRWVPETEIADLIAWSDAVILPYREASQSGVAAAAIAARRWVVATRVGGLVEQFRHEHLAIMCAPDASDLRRAIETLLTRPPALEAAPSDPRRGWLGVATELMNGIGSQVLGRGVGGNQDDRLGAEPLEARPGQALQAALRTS
ncbi:glycosyltransferase [Lichenicola cladoniae]|uniref:Glycosyltransferase n=1 Tax=Lichenicola cladoniae TaxID=1484109 RepID=A0A6M8HPT6_9PROT|nr:glycosyltransferase [Lichenicola cladoniae]NPD67889.1 glycosyltransferase [Acetobacteraceae bacterium]QKE90489.1 glycosyltransferase [Lichenicola cladoniae]